MSNISDSGSSWGRSEIGKEQGFVNESGTPSSSHGQPGTTHTYRESNRDTRGDTFNMSAGSNKNENSKGKNSTTKESDKTLKEEENSYGNYSQGTMHTSVPRAGSVQDATRSSGSSGNKMNKESDKNNRSSQSSTNLNKDSGGYGGSGTKPVSEQDSTKDSQKTDQPPTKIGVDEIGGVFSGGLAGRAGGKISSGLSGASSATSGTDKSDKNANKK